MKTQFSQIPPKKLFLVDGFGAVASAFLLGIVLVHFQAYIGMPKWVLLRLATAACIFAVYDFLCYFIVQKDWWRYLRLIAIVNILYCCVSLGFVYIYFEQLTTLGFAYFFLEKIIVASLAHIELRAVKKEQKKEHIEQSK